ncbi:hypothetical protein EDE15_1222 [Edaphobacter aggregans]|jgi:hypothetical protein|uniref:Uncharacterized protein n=1 Tax=Edaphobacter aggregans TaxID=570835 RepID=A0A3R9NVR2_9BACT|nr:hypothetical protein [Edaphobacter aggregans]RSL15720.1 hypothetical protein EDE15_1222 [Edaphobacter aggregans]
MRKSTRYSLLLMLALIGALAIALILRKAAPPEAARLLPESDAIVYFNVKPLRLATRFDRTPVTHSPDYQHFIDATGIVPERDLDAAAFALHRMDDPNGPNGPVGYSEVFEGRFDGERLAQYLASIATARENYAGHDIFSIPVGEVGAGTSTRRNLRIAQLGYDSIAASNMPTSEQIHSIIDRHRAGASPFSGSSLLSARYRDVPILSSAWAIGRIGLPFSERGYITLFGLQLPLPEDTTFVASLRYVGALHLRIEQIAPTEADAAQSAAALTTLVGLFKSIQEMQPRNSGDKAFLQTISSLKLEQRKDRAILTATVPIELLQQLTGSTSTSSSVAQPAPPANMAAPASR